MYGGQAILRSNLFIFLIQEDIIPSHRGIFVLSLEFGKEEGREGVDEHKVDWGVEELHKGARLDLLADVHLNKLS